MPRYELMYILSADVSDDRAPEVSGQILQFVSDFGGSDIQETQLGKKKLAYTVKKTKNGFYVVVDFTMDATKINDLEAKIHTQDSTIVRYILINMDEHLERLAKDREIQAKMNRNRPPEMIEQGDNTVPVVKKAKVEAPAVVVSDADLEQQIEKALTEDIV